MISLCSDSLCLGTESVPICYTEVPRHQNERDRSICKFPTCASCPYVCDLPTTMWEGACLSLFNKLSMCSMHCRLHAVQKYIYSRVWTFLPGSEGPIHTWEVRVMNQSCIQVRSAGLNNYITREQFPSTFESTAHPPLHFASSQLIR